MKILCFSAGLAIPVLSVAAQTNGLGDHVGGAEKASPERSKPVAEDSSAGRLADELRWLQAEKITVTTASLRDEAVEHAPATMRVITRRQIEERGYRSLQQILRDLPGVDVMNHSQAESENRITFRGITGNNKFLILQDGIRINSPTGEPITPVRDNFALYAAKQVEVLYGPASALYGADAFTGVINIITEDAPREGTVRADFQPGQFDSWGGQFYSAKRFSDSLALSLGGHYQESQGPDLTRYFPAELRLGDLTVGDPPVVVVPAAARTYDAATRSFSSFAKVELWDGLTVGLNQSLFVAPTSAGGVPDRNNYDAEARNHTLLLTTYAKYKFDAGPSTSGQVQVNYSRYEQLPESKFNNAISSFVDAYKYGLGERYQVEANVRYELDKHTLTVGANAELYSSLPHTTDLSTPYDPGKSPGEQTFFYPGSAGTLPVRFFEANYYNAGGFLQVQSEWTDQFSTTAGARFDYNQDYDGTLNPRAGVVYKAAEDTTLKALYGRSFLAPSPFVRYENFGAFGAMGSPSTSFFFRIPNPTLQPEKLQTGELSVSHNFGPNVAATVVGFYTHATDIILPAPASAADLAAFIPGTTILAGDQEQNIGRTHAYGGEFTLDYTLRQADWRADLWGSFTVLDGSLKDERTGLNYELPFTSTEMFKAGVTANYRDRIIFTPSLAWNGPQNAFVTSPDNAYFGQRVRSHTVVNLFAEVRSKNQMVSAYLQVANLLDSRYYNAGQGGPHTFFNSPQDPRWIMGGIKVRF